MNIDVKELEVMEDIASLAVVTGEKKEKYLFWQLEISMAHAKRIDLIVSFLMESGVKMLLPQLKQAQKRGVPIRILTGNYLGITQPSALYLLRSELGDQIDLRFYADSHRSFHPKAYFFYADKESRVFIGSSNISRSALTSGIEWNYCLSSVVDKQAFDQFYASFEDLFYNKSVEITDTVLKKYAKSWVRPAVAKDLARYEKQSEEEKQSGLKQEYQPRGVQIEALYELEKSRKEGAEKGIVHAATGIGKTYLAAFDSLPYKRILFVAHREEILRQAAEAFHNVRPDDSYGFFTGDKKDADADLLFASVASLGKEEVLKGKFSPDSFEYIVMDECHHSTADQYQKILDFFHPAYLLGLTATPERMDGRSVYELYDFEVPYEITLKEAVNRGVLVPFHYYGIMDDTVDYSALHFVRGHYEESELTAAYLENTKRDQLILGYFRKYHPKHALGFCCSRQHASHMAKFFSESGVAAGAVYSREDNTENEGDEKAYWFDRIEAVKKLEVERLSVRITSRNQNNTAKEYYLSDGTPVIRAQLSVKELQEIEKDSALYRIEQTGFFRIEQSGLVNLDSTDLELDPDIDTDSLPVVVVLDSGVNFPDDFANLVPIHWKASDVSGQGTPHGTLVASKVVFSHIGLQLGNAYLRARAKVIDCDIYGEQKSVSQDDMSRRIEEAVVAFHDVARIFNLSSNVDKAIEGDELSILGYQLDCLMRNYGVKFVISAGNHHLAQSCSTLEEILDDTDARIAEPADSMLGITVGAIAGAELGDVFSKRGEPTAYTRIGPGFSGFYKPDLVAYAGNLTRSLKVANDPFSYMIMPGGKLGLDIGTSFSAPVVAGDLAEVAASIPKCDILLAQALLYNGAEKTWDTSKMDKKEAIYMGNQFGRGLSVPENCKFSSPHRVTFLRTGSLRKAHKEHVKFLMPEIQAKTKGTNTTKVIVTCITDSPFDRTKGEQYFGASITASLHKITQKGTLGNGNPNNSDNKEKWDMCNHFENTFSGFGAGMWEIWLDLFTKWDIDESIEIPYHLAVTIEDLTRTNDIYEAIIKESAGRYKPIETVRISVR